MRFYRWARPEEGARIGAFMAAGGHEGLSEPLFLNWYTPISDWLIEEDERGRLRAAAHVVLSKPVAYMEGLTLAPDLTGFARARSVHNGYQMAVKLAKRAGCSVIKFVVEDSHKSWLEALQKRNVKEAEGVYHVMFQEL